MIDKNKFKDDLGRPLTQGLFLEVNYDEKYAVYTLKDDDHEYKGTTYPSLKKLYLKEEDPTEYLFASKHLLGWDQWQRICENRILKKHITEWRNELEMKLRALAIRRMIDMADSENGNFQAAKFLADRGWDKRAAGRPSKAEIEKHMALEELNHNEFNADIKRLEDFRKK